ncbi:hypothetical protein DIPPA_23584 [Diplonema papillatum]|nr:hypothetical protein DIPPA_23584 [Diplonema papillatum]
MATAHGYNTVTPRLALRGPRECAAGQAVVTALCPLVSDPVGPFRRCGMAKVVASQLKDLIEEQCVTAAFLVASAFKALWTVG